MRIFRVSCNVVCHSGSNGPCEVRGNLNQQISKLANQQISKDFGAEFRPRLVHVVLRTFELQGLGHSHRTRCVPDISSPWHGQRKSACSSLGCTRVEVLCSRERHTSFETLRRIRNRIRIGISSFRRVAQTWDNLIAHPIGPPYLVAVVKHVGAEDVG